MSSSCPPESIQLQLRGLWGWGGWGDEDQLEGTMKPGGTPSRPQQLPLGSKATELQRQLHEILCSYLVLLGT